MPWFSSSWNANIFPFIPLFEFLFQQIRSSSFFATKHIIGHVNLLHLESQMFLSKLLEERKSISWNWLFCSSLDEFYTMVFIMKLMGLMLAENNSLKFNGWSFLLSSFIIKLMGHKLESCGLWAYQPDRLLCASPQSSGYRFLSLIRASENFVPFIIFLEVLSFLPFFQAPENWISNLKNEFLPLLQEWQFLNVLPSRSDSSLFYFIYIVWPL